MTCDTVGVISPIVSMVASHQTAEALKILVGDMENMRGKLVSFDLWKNQYSSINMDRLKMMHAQLVVLIQFFLT